MIDDELLDDAAQARSWRQPRPWWAWSALLTALGVALLVWAAARLSSGSLGTSLRSRGCDGDVLGALLLLGAGAIALLVGMTLARLRHPGAVLAVHPGALAWTLPVPSALLAATLPGVAGCRLARSLADLPLVDGALVGASGIVLAGCSVALVAAALAGAIGVSWLAPAVARGDEPPGIVEQALREAEAFEAQRAGERFHGVEPME